MDTIEASRADRPDAYAPTTNLNKKRASDFISLGRFLINAGRLPQHAMQPLDILKLESPQFHANCKIILESLIPISGSASVKYLELRAQEWGGVFMKMLVERDSETSFRSLYRTTNAIESNTGEWPDLLEFMPGSGESLSPILGHKYPYCQRPEFAGRFLPTLYHSPLDSVSIPRRWGASQAKVIKETVPRKFATFPQYDGGSWSFVKGYRPR